MQRDEAVDECQPDAEAAAGAIGRRAPLRKELEDAWKRVRWNASTGIGHFEDRDRVLLAHRHANRSTGWRELHRVVDEVRDDLFDPGLVRIDPHGCDGYDRLMPGRTAGRDESLERVFHDGAEVDRSAAQVDLARCNARHVQKIVDEPREMLDLALDHAPSGYRGVVVLPDLIQHHRGPRDRRERIPQLMAQHGQEFVLDPAGAIRLRPSLL